MQPIYDTVCLDIETADAKPTELERYLRLHWSPNPNWKPDTIGSRYLEAYEKKKAKLALLDASPVICVALKTEQDLRCLHCLKEASPAMVDGALVEGFAGEGGMLRALRNLLDVACDDGTAIVGHNIKHFDLPKLRNRYLRHGLKLPGALVNREQPLYDTMLEFGYSFSLDNDCFVGVKDLAEELGVPHHKDISDGPAVPQLYAAGNFDAIVTYALLDVLLEYSLFLRMTGQNPDPAESVAQAVQAAPAPAVPTIAAARPAAAAEPSTF
jgi:hypothetical protein